MDAVSHKETRALMRAFRPSVAATPPPLPSAAAQSRGLVPAAKKLAMDAVRNVETVAQVGVVKATGGIALYVARIREVDRENRRDREPNRPNRPYGRSQGFLKD